MSGLWRKVGGACVRLFLRWQGPVHGNALAALAQPASEGRVACDVKL